MDLRQLRYFVVLAEELSFTRAAQRLSMTQPPLSQQIKLLEEELGVRLFNRLPRGVSLSDSGKVFMAHAIALTEGARAAIKETVEMASGKTGTIRIGTVNSALFSTVPRILKQLGLTYPNLKVSIVEKGSQAQVDAILRGDLDLGVVHLTNAAKGLQIDRISRERLCAVLPANHPSSQNDTIALSSLATCDFVFASRDVAPASFDHVIAQCMRAGFSPHIRHTAAHLSTIAQMVALGLGVALVPESLRARADHGAKFCSLSDKQAFIELFVVSSKSCTSQAVLNARDAVLQLRQHKGHFEGR